jgi:hypothetical protein
MLTSIVMATWTIAAEALLLVMLVAAFLGLFYAWRDWLSELRYVKLLAWRRAAVSVALFAVTLQAILFVALWTPVDRDHVLLERSMQANFVLMLLAAPCIFTWRPPTRWWLLSSAVFLSVISFFVVLAELTY